MDFYEFSGSSLQKLNATELKLFDYVIGHMEDVKKMNIRAMARNCYVSTATVFRFVKKLGFDGYSDFTALVNSPEVVRSKPAQIPIIMENKEYMQEYLKNLIETVRVIRREQIDKFLAVLEKKPKIYLFSRGLGSPVAAYYEQLFMAFGFDTFRPVEEHQFRFATERVRDEDLCIFLSYTGSSQSIGQTIQRIRATKKAFLMSVTRADNNLVQSLSDLNFYIFADELSCNGFNITSRISMIAVLEDLLYNKMLKDGETLFTQL